MTRACWLTTAWVLLSVGVLATGGCPPAPGQLPPPIQAAAELEAQHVVAAAAHPTALAFAPDGRVFYTEKNTGRIRVVRNGELLPEPFAEVPVNFADERGLLGIALHPQFDRNGRVYVFYTRSDSGANTDDPAAVIDNRVVYFEAASDVAAGGEVFVISLPGGPGTNRIGGRLAFAPDGKLIIALGDLNNQAAVQADELLVGKVLRVNDDGTIPADNPTAGSPVFARGFRHIRGLGFDPANNALFVTDARHSGHEEIDRVLAGRNYGWPDVSGGVDTASELVFVSVTPEYADPAFESDGDRPGLVGGSFNPSTRYGAANESAYFYGEVSRNRVIRAFLNPARDAVADRATFVSGFPAPITDVAFTPAGTLYVATQDAIFRINPQR